jgi:hypothetical protein
MKRTTTFLIGAILAIPGLMVFGTTSPASAKTMFIGLGDLPGGGFLGIVESVFTEGSAVVEG